MKLQVFSVLDKAVKAYLQPFYCRSKGEAIRSFTELANEKQSNVGKHPHDFDLYYLGEYDDNAGMFSCPNGPERMLSAMEVMKDE